MCELNIFRCANCLHQFNAITLPITKSPHSVLIIPVAGNGFLGQNLPFASVNSTGISAIYFFGVAHKKLAQCPARIAAWRGGMAQRLRPLSHCANGF